MCRSRTLRHKSANYHSRSLKRSVAHPRKHPRKLELQISSVPLEVES